MNLDTPLPAPPSDRTSQEDTHTATTFDSYEFSREEAEEINRSMDMSMEFWGHVRDTSGIIPATRLKCVRGKPTRQTEMARVIWNKLSQNDQEVLKKVEGILMMNGEITIEQLFEALEKISEIINYSFQDMFPEYCNDDIINSAVSIMSELLYIYNQNEPPQITVDEDYFPTVNTGLILIKDEPAPVEKKANSDEAAQKMNRLLKKARKHGIEHIRVPSSSYISDRSKLLIIEKQVNAKIRLQKLNKAITNQNVPNQEEKRTFQAKREVNKIRDNVQNKPAFRTTFKPRPVEYNALKNVPNLQKRMKKTRKRIIETQMRTDFFEGNKQFGDEVRQVSYARFFDSVKTLEGVSKSKSIQESLLNTNQQKVFPSDPNTKAEDIMRKLSPSKNVLKKKSDDSVKSTQPHIMEPSNNLIHLLQVQSNLQEIFTTHRDESEKNNIQKSIESHESTKEKKSVSDSKTTQNKDKMLNEMKTMLKEVLKEVGQTSSALKEEQVITTNKVMQLQEFSKLKDTETSELVSKIDETEVKVDIQRLVSEEGDTLDISVTQDSMNPLLWPLPRDQDRIVTTEISVSKFSPGPAVRLSLVNRVKSEEEELSKLAKEKPERVQEAVSFLNELLDTNAQEREVLKEENQEKPEGGTTQTDDITKLEKSSVNVGLKVEEVKEEVALEETLHTLNVNMAMLVEDLRLEQPRTEDARTCRLWQLMVGEDPPRVQEEIGDVGLWNSWQESNTSMDSLYVNVDRRNLEFSDSEQGYMSTASSSTTDADRLMSPDKKNSVLKKDGGPSIFSLVRHQQAEGRGDRQAFIDGKTTPGPPQEVSDRMKNSQPAEQDSGQNQESEEVEDRQHGLTHAGGSSGKSDHGSESGNYMGKECVDQNVNEDHNQMDQKERELCENIESRENELQQMLLLESQEYKQCLLIEEENLKESLENRGRDLQETFELRGEEVEQSPNNEEQCSKDGLKNRIEGFNEGLEDGKANVGDAKALVRSGGVSTLEQRGTARWSWLRLVLLPVWLMFGIITFPVIGPYTLITKLYDGLFRTRHTKKEPPRGENSSASSV